MRLLACVLPLLIAPVAALAQQSASAMDAGGRGAVEAPVVLEFYTSQGCVSCPPADAIFADLAREEGVIALALHVDYWDYLGWPDSFAKPEFTQRQKGYARVMRQRTLFTPQMVIQGEDLVVGRDAATIADRIDAHRHMPAPVLLDLERDGPDALRVTLTPAGRGVGPADVHLFTYLPREDVDITEGENAGQTVTYTNAQWDGASALEIDFGPVPPGPLVVLVQRQGLGPVLNAARLD
jgi:hypothetical protein